MARDAEYRYYPVGWAHEQVKEGGKLLVFDVEPAGRSGIDVQTCTELAEVFDIIEGHADDMWEPKVEIKVTARWVTPEEFAREQEDWAE